MNPNLTTTSIVDYLKSTGGASDFTSRAALATKSGITGYTGTATQNTQLLGLLRSPTPTTTTPVLQAPSVISNIITPQKLTTATPINVPQVPALQVDTTTAYAKTVADQTKTALTTSDTTQTAEGKQASNLTTMMSELLDTTKGQSAMLSAEQAKAGGANEIKIQTTTASNKLASLIAEREALTVDNEGKPVTMDSIVGRQRQINAVLDSKIFTQTAVIKVLQGNYDDALEDAQRAVDTKYAPIIEKYNIWKEQLALLQPTLTAQEKIRAEAVDATKAKALSDTNVLIANAKDLSATLLNQMQTYPDAGITLQDTIQSANTKITSKSKIYQDKIRGPVSTALTDSGLNTRQTTNFLRISDNYNKSEIINNGIKATTLIEISDQVIANPGNAANQLKALYTLIKALDPDSAVREGEVVLAERTQSYLQTFEVALTKIFKGQVVHPDIAVQLATASKELASAWQDTSRRKTQTFQSQATVADVGPAFKQFLDGASVNTAQKVEAPKLLSTADLDKLETKSSVAPVTKAVETLQSQPEGFFNRFLNIFGF